MHEHAHGCFVYVSSLIFFFNFSLHLIWHSADAGQAAKFYPTEAEETYLFLAKCQRCEEGFNERQQFLRHCGMQPGQLFGEEPKVLAAMDCYLADA